MLRNQTKSQKLLKNLLLRLPEQRTRLIHQQTQILYQKSSDVFRQGKIMGKLFGNRVSGSKKRWFPTNDSAQATSSSVLFRQSQFGKAANGGGKNATRRMTVLNKLFMKHITDLMATGEISEAILGKGLQVSRVKISQDFAYVNVFWLSTGDMVKDALLEHELKSCAGLLRHELSQLCLMGVVPRIKFIKDKLFTNMNQVEALLKDMDFGPEEVDVTEEGKQAAENVKQEFFGGNTTVKPALKEQEEEPKESLETNKTSDVAAPQMRHDVLGLDHKGIMLKILTKMRKSKQAWEQHIQNNSPTNSEMANTFESSSSVATIPTTSFEQLDKINAKLDKATANSEKFDAFLTKRKEKRNTPERKKFRPQDHHFDDGSKGDQCDLGKLVMSPRQRQLFEADDYLLDEIEEGKRR